VEPLALARRRFVGRITARFFVRFHMGLIFGATVAAAVVTSRLLLGIGVDSLMVRYAIAAAGAYLVFFVFVRAWIFHVTRLAPHNGHLDLPDSWPSGHGSGPSFHGGGGQAGGGGASGSFDSSVDEAPVLRTTGNVGGGGKGGGWDLPFDVDDGLGLVIALIALVACLAGAAIWLVWQAPLILPEAAFEALLAAGLVRAARRGEARGWARGVLRATIIPFLLVWLAATFVGWAAHRACPEATRLADVFHGCPGDASSRRTPASGG
jgi:hypothetical protein